MILMLHLIESDLLDPPLACQAGSICPFTTCTADLRSQTDDAYVITIDGIIGSSEQDTWGIRMHA